MITNSIVARIKFKSRILHDAAYISIGKDTLMYLKTYLNFAS